MAIIHLPEWNKPSSVTEAQSRILNLGRSLHEHAYLVGKDLLWVKTAKKLGDFQKWIDDNLWFGTRTAQRFMAFTRRCESKNRLLCYHADADKSDIKSHGTSIPRGLFRVIYADPPWQYSGSIEPDRYGVADNHYPTMNVEELCELQLPNISNDAVLFLWSTSPMLPEALQVMEAWAFEYKASFIWDKVKHNYGHYNSVRHELLLIGTRGSCLPDSKKLHDSVQVVERLEHSEKPPEFRSLIDEMYPEGERIELFARGTLPKHWAGFGNELIAAAAD